MIISMETIVEDYLNFKYDSCGEKKEKIEILIESILSSKYHFLRLKNKSYFELKKANFLSTISKAALEHICNNVATKLSEIKKIKYLVEITEDGNNIKRKEQKDLCYLVPIEVAIKISFDECLLITENIIDSKIYLEFGKLYLEKCGYKNVDISLFPIGSGGGQVSIQYKTSIIEKKKQGICIVDSDKKYPNCDKGETSKKLEKIITNEAINEVFILENQRELENFIPYTLLESFCPNVKYSFNKSLKNNFSPEEIKNFYRYFDVKNDLHLKNIRDEEWFNFWKKLLKKLDYPTIEYVCNEQRIKYSSFKEIERLKESTEDLKKINYKFCEGYGEKISEYFLKFLVRETIEKCKEEIEKKKELQINKEKLKEIILKKEEELQLYLEEHKKLLTSEDIKVIALKIIEWGCNLKIPNKFTSI